MCITFICVCVHSYDYIYSNVSGNNIVSSISCIWVNEYISFICVVMLGGGCDEMGDRGDGNCIGVDVWSVSVMLWCPMILGEAGTIITCDHVMVFGVVGLVVILLSLSRLLVLS